MSGSATSDLPLSVIEERRDTIERLASSDLPIAKDAQQILELLDGQEETR